MKIRDISHHDTDNGSVLDLSGYDGVIVKATQGVGYVDPALDANVNAAKIAGKPYGLYHYLSFATPIGDQIAAFSAQLAKYGGWTLRPMLDIETDDNINKTVPADIVQRVQVFCRNIPGCAAYANLSFIREHMDAFTGIDIWQAEYHPAVTDIPGVNRIGWQYRENPDESDFTDAVMISGASLVAQPPSGDPAILAIQQKLNRVQIPRPPLEEDGLNGPKTKDAVIAFEQVMGLTVDSGVWGGQCEAAYNTVMARPMIKQGSTGQVVRYLQYRLGLTFDGQFGQNTKGAVQLFQQSAGLDGDGIVGNLTWGKLIG